MKRQIDLLWSECFTEGKRSPFIDDRQKEGKN